MRVAAELSADRSSLRGWVQVIAGMVAVLSHLYGKQKYNKRRNLYNQTLFLIYRFATSNGVWW
jgi:hypothetical protein